MSASNDGYDERLTLAGDELARLVRRLRGFSPSAWNRRRPPVVSVVARLAELTARAEHLPVPTPPAIDDHALADAVAVIGGDVMVALAEHRDDEVLDWMLAELRAALEATR